MNLKNTTVLFVDDNTEIQKIMKNILEEKVHTFYAAKNGEEGLALYELFKPDIVITDVKMPKLDGLEMSKEIKKIHKNQCILLLSSFSEIDIFKQAIDIKINKFFSKPLEDLEYFLEFLESMAISIHKQKELDMKKYQLNEKNEMIDKHIMFSLSDLNGNITDISSAFLEMSGYEKSEVLGANHNIFRGQNYSVEKFRQMWQDLNADKTWVGEFKNVTKDGKFYWVSTLIEPMYDETGAKIGYKSIKQDITDKKKVKYLSEHDTLTGLGNRRYLEDNFKICNENVIRHDTVCSFIMIDIDNFKGINDKYGHLIGDEILKQLSNIFSINTRKADFIARWGGEEFAILTPNLSIEESLKFAQKLRIIIENSNFINDIKITCSMGISSLSKDMSMDDTTKIADDALYHSKSNGKNQVSISKQGLKSNKKFK